MQLDDFQWRPFADAAVALLPPDHQAQLRELEAAWPDERLQAHREASGWHRSMDYAGFDGSRVEPTPWLPEQKRLFSLRERARGLLVAGLASGEWEAQGRVLGGVALQDLSAAEWLRVRKGNLRSPLPRWRDIVVRRSMGGGAVSAAFSLQSRQDPSSADYRAGAASELASQKSPYLSAFGSMYPPGVAAAGGVLPGAYTPNQAPDYAAQNGPSAATSVHAMGFEAAARGLAGAASPALSGLGGGGAMYDAASAYRAAEAEGSRLAEAMKEGERRRRELEEAEQQAQMSRLFDDLHSQLTRPIPIPWQDQRTAPPPPPSATPIDLAGLPDALPEAWPPEGLPLRAAVAIMLGAERGAQLLALLRDGYPRGAGKPSTTVTAERRKRAAALFAEGEAMIAAELAEGRLSIRAINPDSFELADLPSTFPALLRNGRGRLSRSEDAVLFSRGGPVDSAISDQLRTWTDARVLPRTQAFTAAPAVSAAVAAEASAEKAISARDPAARKRLVRSDEELEGAVRKIATDFRADKKRKVTKPELRRLINEALPGLKYDDVTELMRPLSKDLVRERGERL